MDWPTLLLLIVQAALAVTGLGLLNRKVFPAMGAARQPELIADVWVPLAVVLPMLFLAGRVDMTVRGVGWVPVGGPVCAGILALGAATLAARGALKEVGADHRALACWAGAGLVLLMLGAAHDLTVWTGQCAFALAAVLLWMNTPPLPHSARTAPAGRPTAAGPWMGAVFLCAIGQGVVGLLLTGSASAISAAMMVGYAAAAGAGAATLGGPAWAVRIGGWSAAIGMLLGVGLISLLRLAPQALAVAVFPQARVSVEVAHSFGAYALEGMLLLLLPAAALAAVRLPQRSRWLLGAGMIFVGAAVAGWRVAYM
jgi:hypothetical protein